MIDQEALQTAYASDGIYALQLVALQALDWGLPHFGLMDRFPLNVGYARNYFDSDQRPLRAMLEAWDGPSLVLHGAEDHQRMGPTR